MRPHDHPVSLPGASSATGEGVTSRRDFLAEAVSVVACAAALGTLPGTAFGLPIRFTTALGVLGGEAVYPIPQQDGATIDREREVILVRSQNQIYGFGLSCPHQRTALRWQEEERRFQCPKHKSTFQLDGAFLAGRATRSLDRYPIRREGDTVVVDLATLLREDKDRERWLEAVVQL